MGWLTWRVYHRGGSTFTAGSSPILPPDAYFFAVRSAGSQIGVASITVDTLSDGVQITELMGLDLPITAGNARSQYTSRYTIGTNLRLRDFSLTLPGSTDPIVQHGVVEGDSVIIFTPGTGEPRWRLAVSSHSLIPVLAAPVSMALQQKLREGERLRVPTFDPVTMLDRSILLEVTGDSVFLVPDSAEFDSLAGAWVAVHSDTIPAWKVRWSDGEQDLAMWVDGRGLPIQVQSTGGLELERSAFEIVTINYRRRRPPRGEVRPAGIIPRTVIASNVSPETGVSGLRVTSSRPILRDSAAFQFMDRDTVVTAVAVVDPTAIGYELPAADTALARWLADEPHLAIADSVIVNQARKIVAGGRNPLEATRLLVSWVSRTIGRSPEAVVPRAATVLRNRQADVDGHTVLFVALARAAGLPARPVSGIVLAGDRFYFHSWAEVYLDQWVPVDPTWNESPAGANRIRLATGSLARPLELLPLSAGVDLQLLTLTRRP